MKNVAVYLRSSINEDIDNLNYQSNLINSYMIDNLHNDGKVIHFIDNGVSGKGLDGKALNTLLAEIEKGNINKLIVLHKDRLTRREDILIELEKNLMNIMLR
ncbi:recombinase family protein [Breznakia pachnodae]|uniref:DNA invertase Pin-like site-specific DNA recombinase n=1 Tax=Breznakia pachnodae TaxID=265178 RepID=A0ABU0DZM4_9FIRM|nr:recombinase family protein [Breznakia pachnodae]MDQ0359974.1 DNA invertase Pin-like site-specific DNA recombinase [Breznakia pachnodae]